MKRVLAYHFLLLWSALFCLSCAGGGTAGTGGQSFTGRLVTTEQIPLADVIITILESGDSGVTDTNGKFLIEADTTGGDLTFEFSRNDITATLVIPSIPAEAESVDLELEYSAPENKVTPKKIEIQERPASSSAASESGGSGGNSGSNNSGNGGVESSATSSANSANTGASSSKSSCRPRSTNPSPIATARGLAFTQKTAQAVQSTNPRSGVADEDAATDECEDESDSSKSASATSRSLESEDSSSSTVPGTSLANSSSSSSRARSSDDDSSDSDSDNSDSDDSESSSS